jgi:site-specific DNA recombinase
MSPEQPQALVYCRVSTSGQEEDGTSLDSQETACRRYAEEHGYTVGRVTREVYSGAELWDRPQLTRDREDIKRGAFAALIAYSTDRLARDPVHLSIVADDCERYGCALLFATEAFDDTDEGRLLRYVMGFSAKKEREKIRERSLRGKHTRVLSGKVTNMGPELYGYRRDKAAGVRVLYEPEAAVVRQVFALVAVERLAYHAVAVRLNQAETPAPGGIGVRWRADSVYRIIRNPAYKGEEAAWRWQRESRPREDPITHVLSKAQKPYRLVKRAASEHVPLPAGVTPAIVSAEAWQAAQAAARAQVGDHTRNEQTPYLLRGMLYCGTCDKKMWPHWSRKSGGDPRSDRVRTYRCASRNGTAPSCGGGIIRADAVEAWAWDRVAGALRDAPEWIPAELERRRAARTDGVLTSDLQKARAKVRRCEREQADYLRRHSERDDDGKFPWALVEREVARLEAEKREWQATAAELVERIARQDLAVAQLEHVQAFCAHSNAQLEYAGFEEKRVALLALAVTVRGNGIDWRIDGNLPVDGTADVLSITSPGWRRRRGS